MLRAILNKSWWQHLTRHQLYGHLPPITKIIQVRRTRHAGHCWRSGDELISDVLLWTPTYGRAKAGRPARTYIQQLCEDTGCGPEDLPEAMNDRKKWREKGQGNPCVRHDMMMMMIPGQSEPGSNVNEGLLRIPQSPSISGNSPSDCLVSYQDTQFGVLTLLQRCNWCNL